MRTLVEVQTELSYVNAAIQSILEGKRINELRIGSGDFLRSYVHSEITLETLITLRNSLLTEIDALSPPSTPVFRNNATIPLVVTK